jgi:hypothetical protein
MTAKKRHLWNSTDPSTFPQYAGEYSDRIERQPKLQRGPNFQKPKKKKK